LGGAEIVKPYVLTVIAVAVLFYLGMEVLSRPTDQQQSPQIIKGSNHNETMAGNSPARGVSDDHKFELMPDPWGNDPPVSTKTYSVAMLADNEDIIPPGTQLFFAGRLSGYTTAWANTGGIGHFAPVALIVDDVEKSLENRTVLDTGEGSGRSGDFVPCGYGGERVRKVHQVHGDQ